MGGNQAAIFQQGEPLSNYDVVQKVPEHNVSYLKHKITNKEYMIKQFAINDKAQFTQTFQKLKNRKKMQSQYLTKLQRFSEQLEDHLCSSFYKIFAMWEYPSHTLADQINQRALQKRRFQQNQIFSIIASVIEGMSCLQSSGVKHQTLTTIAILFDQIGAVKVTDPLTSINASNFQRVNTNRKIKNIYIAPQQCQSLKNQRPIPNRNSYKSDVFVLGVILLECGLLQRMDTIYVDQFQDIDWDQLQSKLNQFAKIYSKDLKLTVETMLTKDPKERMDWIGLKQYVPQKKQGQNEKQKNESGNKALLSNNYYSGTGNIVGKNEMKPQGNSSMVAPKVVLGGKTDQNFTGYSRNVIQNSTAFTPSVANISLYSQPTATFNQTFGQSIQSYTYQPPTKFTSGNLNNLDIKYSNYVYDSKPNFTLQRPTEEFNSQNIVPHTISKMTSDNPLIERQSSSFPLTSQIQFKKDYSIGNNFSSSYGIDYVNSYSGLKAVYTGSNNTYTGSTNNPYPLSSGANFSSNYNNFTGTQYVPSYQMPQQTQSSSGVKNIAQLNTINKSFNNNDKTEINSQMTNSPMISNYVKDAKSITYEKNLYSSYLNDEKNNIVNHQTTNQNNQPQQGAYSTVVTSNDTLNYYRPISKNNNVGNNANDSNNYVVTSNPILYQPLSSNTGIQSRTNKELNFDFQNNTNTGINYKKQVVKEQEKNVKDFNTDYTGKQIQQNLGYQYTQIQSNLSQKNVVPSNLPSNQAPQLQYVIEHFKQGSRYQGTKYQDMRHGQGKFFYQDGGMYEGKYKFQKGNWKYNKMDGFGKLYYQSGKIAYEGNWSDDQFQGYGKLYNEQPDELQEMFDCQNFDLIDEFWVFYEGNFIGDEKDGEGKMAFSNGEFFMGNFHKDMVDGPGQFHRMNGEVVRGVWSQNQLIQQE